MRFVFDRREKGAEEECEKKFEKRLERKKDGEGEKEGLSCSVQLKQNLPGSNWFPFEVDFRKIINSNVFILWFFLELN